MAMAWADAGGLAAVTAVAIAQIGVAAALRAMPLSALRTGGSRLRPLGQFFVRGSDERIAWAIEAAGRRLGRLSTCLTRALVAELVLNARRAGQTARSESSGRRRARSRRTPG